MAEPTSPDTAAGTAPAEAEKEGKPSPSTREQGAKKDGAEEGKEEEGAEAKEDDGDGDEEDLPKPRKPKEVRIQTKDGGVVYRIEIEDVIDLGLAPFVERSLERAAKDPKAVAVLSHIHTPGGRVDAAVRIRDALLRSKVPTIALIESEAISAGALIALAHDYIVIVPGGTIGAATPIQMAGGGEAQAVGEKMVSYVRGVFRATAEAKDRDPAVAEAMVDKDKVVPKLAPKGKLLTMSAMEAHAWGVADLLLDDEEAMMKETGLAGQKVVRVVSNWAERIARVLTHPVVSGLLMTFGFLGLLMEFYSPGFGVTGAIGLTCLFLFFFGHYVVRLAGLEELGMFLLGLALLAVELFVTPGFGLLGAAGLGLVLAGLVLSLIALPIDVSFDTGELASAFVRVMVSLAATIVMAVVLGKKLGGWGAFRRLVLADAVTGRAVGFGGPQAQDGEPRPESAAAGEAPPPGSFGVARTDLRPSGKVRVAGGTYDAITGGEGITKGARVEVRGTRGSALVVREAEGESEEGPGEEPANA